MDSLLKITQKPSTYLNLAAVLILMIVNWGLEAKKWQVLLRRITPIAYSKAFVSTLSGITVSFFTPNRMGEFLGRVLHVDKDDRIKASLSSVLGSLSQTIVTIIIGAICAANIITDHLDWAAEYPILFWTILLLLLTIFLLLFFRSDLLAKFLSNMNVIKRYSEQLSVLSQYSTGEKMTILCYSLLRYVVFSLQFLILLLTLEVWIQPLLAFKLIATLFLVLTVVPGTALTELAVRGSVALALFGSFSDNQSGILAATFLLWLINLVLPAAAGTFSIFFIRLANSRNNSIQQ